MSLVNEQRFPGQVGGQLVRGQEIERRVSTSQSMNQSPGLPQVGEKPSHGAKLFAAARAHDEVLWNFHSGNSDAPAFRKCHCLIVAKNEATLDLFLRRREHAMPASSAAL